MELAFFVMFDRLFLFFKNPVPFVDAIVQVIIITARQIIGVPLFSVFNILK